MNKILHGDCAEKIKTLEKGSIRTCITSPPYAKQRKLYDGINETEYPTWTGRWMEALRPKLSADGSVLIVIRPHLKGGVISDYVLRTRLALREGGWNECEELVWLKSDAPPLGSVVRPRRTWESILWFSKTNKPFVNLRACGRDSERIGAFAGSSRFGHGGKSPLQTGQRTTFRQGTSRCSDVFVAAVGSIEKGIMHPAMFPASLSDQLVLTFSEQGDTVLDPFVGSGQTVLSAKRLLRRYVGIDAKAEYVRLARERLLAESTRLHRGKARMQGSVPA